MLFYLLMIKKCTHSIRKKIKLLGSFVETCNLQDLGYMGPSFTWQRARIEERLDRALENDYWISAFPQSLVSFLSRVKSDHRPILLRTKLSF